MADYKLSKVSFYPATIKSWTQLKGKSYIGLSVNNSRVRDEGNVKEIFSKVLEHFETTSALVGDHLHRHTLMISEGISEAEAAEKARVEGGKLIERIAHVLGAAVMEKVSFISTEPFYSEPSFKERLNYFIKSYKKDPNFNMAVNAAINFYLERIKVHKNVAKVAATELCLDYLMEELVVFESLTSKGYLVNIYPGSIPIIKDFATGYIKGVSKELENVQLAQLHFKPLNK